MPTPLPAHAPVGTNRNTNRDFYTYQNDFVAIGAGNTVVQSFAIEADSDFILHKLTYMADISNATQTDGSRVIPLCSILITDTGSGRILSSLGVPITNIFGTGEIPFILPVPRLFKARSSISLSVNNFSSATVYNLKLSFIGAKVFH